MSLDAGRRRVRVQRGGRARCPRHQPGVEARGVEPPAALDDQAGGEHRRADLGGEVASAHEMGGGAHRLELVAQGGEPGGAAG